jgi:sialate O-acetylesterase
MAVIHDTVKQVSDIHPTNKQEVARRLGAMVLSKFYQRDLGVVDSPLFAGFRAEGGRLRVRFEHAQNGLATRDGNAPSHLEVAGEDGVFHPATGAIEGSDLWVSSPAVSAPKQVRFAWDEEAISNLMNREGYPVAPFHSAKWPLPLGEERR